MDERIYEYWKNEIVKVLKRKKRARPLDIARKLGVHPSTILKWLTVLELRGVVKSERVGRERFVELVRK